MMRVVLLIRRLHPPPSGLWGWRPTSGTRNRVFTAVVLLTLVAVASAARAEVIDRILAVVNGRVIMLSDVRGVMEFGLLPGDEAPDTQEKAVARLIERELILAEVERYAPPAPDSATIQRRLDAVRARFATPGAFQAALRAAGLSDARLRAILRDTIRIERYLEERFGAAGQPTEDEVVRYYRDHEARFTEGGRLASLDEARDFARQQLAAERRTTLIAEWLAGLLRRAELIRLDGKELGR